MESQRDAEHAWRHSKGFPFRSDILNMPVSLATHDSWSTGTMSVASTQLSSSQYLRGASLQPCFDGVVNFGRTDVHHVGAQAVVGLEHLCVHSFTPSLPFSVCFMAKANILKYKNRQVQYTTPWSKLWVVVTT